ncbi:PAS domain S-box protein [Saccharopolyspora sp. HNM0983]|uniref:PAS domain S-box protein n=1 Tax=Saccharopolyspora montiporae TaxID=2781240 RepID=A0A929FZT0_9PSEU|nr:PAS domain S-box protein [Saccharopolyspora sp. HNM0983]MBE9372878.1 PAS domain S-box protein [Saccharopolyspora sp. HNM0983]
MEMPRLSAADLPWLAILDQAAGPLAVLDLHGRYVHVNPAGCRLLGRNREELIGRVPADFTHPDDPAVAQSMIDRAIEGPENSFEIEKRYVCSDGSVILALVINSLIRNDNGDPAFFVSQVHDITARREIEKRWQQTMNYAPIGMALLDLDGNFTEVNSKLSQLTGYDRDELLSMTFADITYTADMPATMSAFNDVLEGREEAVGLEKRYRHKNGHPVWVFTRTSVVPDGNDRPSYLVSQFETIGEESLGDRRLAHLALHDPLTGLANRVLLTERLEHDIRDLPRKDHVLAVLLIDVDNLKPTNDRYGHAIGDELLTRAADDMLDAVCAGDTVARLGGDEFVVFGWVTDFADAESFRRKISSTLNTEVALAGHRLSRRASVGLAIAQDSSTSADALLDSADRDMYRRKQDRAQHDSASRSRQDDEPR